MADRTPRTLPLRAMGIAAVASAIVVVLAVLGLRAALPEQADAQASPSASARAGSTAAEWTAIGLEQYAAGDLVGAEKSFVAATELDPADPVAVFNVGSVRDALGDTAGARELYTRALAMDPSLADARFNLAVLLAREGDAAGAKKAYRAVLAQEPDRAAAHWNLGLLLYEEGRIATGRQHLNRAVEIDPSFESRLPEGVTLS